MASHESLPLPDPYYRGYEDGLIAARSVAPKSRDLQVLTLAQGLTALGDHALELSGAPLHEACMECETILLLARVVAYGEKVDRRG